MMTKGSTNSGGSLTVDYNSVMALGYGQISEATLAEKVKSGEVKMYENNGRITFERANKNNNTLTASSPSNTGGTTKSSGGKTSVQNKAAYLM